MMYTCIYGNGAWFHCGYKGYFFKTKGVPGAGAEGLLPGQLQPAAHSADAGVGERGHFSDHLPAALRARLPLLLHRLLQHIRCFV
ncbi:unnamed protein product [Leptidea sinapis]|uniref:Uncharacterized protein n=1 Tax=Leptidea sinapis TaxID=189913 RepID=A0A5E4Q0B1_9NEOP|nr:unnamed protein product [Leptidea sinapis]VVC91107.1 unnamed protein product [Leptidea sinapis]